MIGLSIPRKVRRAGLVVAGFSLFMTAGMAYQTYVFWHSPPPVVSEDVSATIADVAIIMAGFITVVPGLYITRQIYRWSMTDPNPSDSE